MTPFLRAYLVAWLLCLAAALGSMSIVMLHHLTGGNWGRPIRRPAEAAAVTLPLLTLLFIPIALGANHLYPWAMPINDEILKHRQVFFAPAPTLIRSFLYLIIWSIWAWRLRSLSLQQDLTPNSSIAQRLTRWSAIGLVVYFATMSLASVDWIASREVDWYSSTFGLAVILGQSTTAVAFLILTASLLSRRPAMSAAVIPSAIQDLGNLLLTVVVLWAYVAFAQFLVIWMGNSQEDILWFVHRTTGTWWYVGLSVILLHFALPFALLLVQRAKRHLPTLAAIAAGLLAMRAVDVIWMIAPSSRTAAPAPFHWLYLIVPAALAALWFGSFLHLLNQHPLVPINPQPQETPFPHAGTEPTTLA